MHRRLAVFIAVNVVEPLGQVRWQAAVAVALEEYSRAAPEHTFVGGHPLDAETVCDGQRLLRHTALGRPHALRPHAKHLLMKIKRAHQLFACIFWMPKPVLGKGRPGDEAAPALVSQTSGRIG